MPHLFLNLVYLRKATRFPEHKTKQAVPQLRNLPIRCTSLQNICNLQRHWFFIFSGSWLLWLSLPLPCTAFKPVLLLLPLAQRTLCRQPLTPFSLAFPTHVNLKCIKTLRKVWNCVRSYTPHTTRSTGHFPGSFSLAWNLPVFSIRWVCQSSFRNRRYTWDNMILQCVIHYSWQWCLNSV